MKPIINEIDPDLLSKIESNGTLEQINFALYAGLWDGMIGLIGGIGDGIKMLNMNLATANEDAKKESAKMSKLISDNGGGIGGFGRLVWDGIRSGFDTDQPCVFAHTVGEFTFGIILGVLTGGEALASTAVGKVIKSSVVVLDRLDVVSQVVSKTAGCALKITYKAGKPVFNVLYQGVKVLPKFFEAPVSGKLYSFIIPLPQVNLKGGIEAFKEAIAKGEVKVERVLDEADNIIVDEEGNILNKAITKEGEEVELLEKVTGVGSLVPNSLITKLTQQGANKLKAWTSGKTLNYKSLSGATAEAKIFDDLDIAIGSKNVLETFEDAQGRLSVVLERPGQTHQVVTVHPTSTGELKMTTFEPAYNPNLNPNIPVPASANKLAPDFAGTQYFHPLNQGKVIKIKMSGKRNGSTGDFALADAEMRKIDPNFVKPSGYTWHHLDDFNPVTGECTMQLVESAAHQGTGVVGMAHSGSVAQWKAYYGTISNAPNNLFYQQ